MDENGKIYYNEFLAATISSAIFLKEENLKEAFYKFDIDKKGYFDLSDFIKAMDNESGMSLM